MEAALQFLATSMRDAESAMARVLMGEICSKTNRRNDAIAHYRRAVELNPGNAVAHAHYADAVLLGDPSIPLRREALEHLRTAVRLDPGFLTAHNNLANALAMLGNREEAINEYAKLLNQSPGYPAAILGMVRTYEALGRIEEAEALLRPWIGDTANPEIALAFGTIASHIGKRREAIELLRNAAGPDKCDPEMEQTACYQLGDLLDGEGDHDAAFGYYARANALCSFKYNHPAQVQRFTALIDFFNANQIPELPRASNRSKLPVFIVGMPRSGTTLVETILASHPLVHGAGELGDIFEMYPELVRASGTGKPYPQCLKTISAGILDQFADRYLANLASRASDVTRVTDKMPHNFVQLGLIDLLFPGARVIHCIRDPLDTCLSIYFHPFIEHHAYATDLTNLGLYYREYLRLMAHWRTVLRLPLLELRYEELVENPEEKIRQLLDFCELSWDERCLRHHETGRVANTFSYKQVRQPIYKKSVARWRRYEKHLGPLIEALGDVCDPLSGAA
jgi:tetratricopeptide (TPR) repeat protein